MANILDIVRGLSQAAANAYDGYENMDEKIGLNREEGHPVLDSRLMDGFRVRFAADNLIVTYHGEVLMKEIHPRGQFENEIERILLFFKLEVSALILACMIFLHGEAKIALHDRPYVVSGSHKS